MSEDIQIGGDVGFRAIGIAVVMAEGRNALTDEHRKTVELLLGRANRLLSDLDGFFDKHPEMYDMRQNLVAE